MVRIAAVFSLFLLISACAVSTRARVEKRFVEFGVSENRARCLAKELDHRLDGGDLGDVADFIGNLNEAASAGEALDSLLAIDNPNAAAAIVPSGFACTFRS